MDLSFFDLFFLPSHDRRDEGMESPQIGISQCGRPTAHYGTQHFF